MNTSYCNNLCLRNLDMNYYNNSRKYDLYRHENFLRFSLSALEHRKLIFEGVLTRTWLLYFPLIYYLHLLFITRNYTSPIENKSYTIKLIHDSITGDYLLL